MLWLTIEILLSLNFLASIALYSPIKVVILALRAYPSTIWKIKWRFSLNLYYWLRLCLRDKVWVIVLNCIYQLLILSLRMWSRYWLLGLTCELLLLLLSSLNNLFSVSQSAWIALYQVFFLIIFLLIWALSFKSCNIKVVFLEFILKSTVLIQHHLELLDLLKATLPHYWRQLTQIRHMIGVHREYLSLSRRLQEGISSWLLICIGLKVSDILEYTPIIVVNNDVVDCGNLLLRRNLLISHLRIIDHNWCHWCSLVDRS